jgi:hypothetical protein
MIQILPPSKFELITLGIENRTSAGQRFLLKKASNLSIALLLVSSISYAAL